MGPRRGKAGAKLAKRGHTAGKNAAAEDPCSIDKLLTKTQELMDDNKHDQALQYVAKAINLDGQSTQALLLAAIIQLDIGNIEPAISCLLKSVEIEPDRGFEKYMYLGQLMIELEAVKYFQLGVNAMQRDLEELPETSSQATVLKRKMAEAYVAMTEIYLTDCCFEDDAEKKCEEFLANGLKVDPECPEIHQTMASVRLSQNRLDDARECLCKSMSLWTEKDQNDTSQIPSFETRLALVRLLLEVDDKDQALSILERLQKEDDESIDMWYLYGWTYHLQSEEEETTSDGEENADLLRSSRECFNQVIRLAGILDYDNDELIGHARELVAAINTSLPPSADDDDDDINGNTAREDQVDDVEDMGWEDASSDEDVDMGS
ncbi:hypothetical protein IW140_002865 [Coemansia sp. RSA 1813]|nr:hypothetical protein EV178_002784 [Coemansia sp. RSA 1646]KAJ1771074.1 hypothetical protein LPJ74_002661 [Coemansia sp. RSA 1843]KAJ2089819.1 hypothetical protein IW138_003113 [Coemansia sp. RSA 986]KAJ2214795.1 hypothetical protein EV179_002743 [Coemansia sp. RSA 487]KAJ2569784.1 hypothetical protein IW140_002865 [Coemansia sp. RSA 1813]